MKREGQTKFSREVRRRYGDACIACGMQPVEAAHIVAVCDGGEMDPLNGLPMCRTHHYAFDDGHWAIVPGLHLLVPLGGRYETTQRTLARSTLDDLACLPGEQYLVRYWLDLTDCWLRFFCERYPDADLSGCPFDEWVVDAALWLRADVTGEKRRLWNLDLYRNARDAELVAA